MMDILINDLLDTRFRGYDIIYVMEFHVYVLFKFVFSL